MKRSRTRLLVDKTRRLYVETASGHVDYPIRYHNGKVAWDRPEAVPPAIRRQALSRFVRAFARGEPYRNDCYEETADN